MIFQIRAYLRFLCASTNAHGVQSPFVFDLVTKCFYDRKYRPDYKTLAKIRSELQKDHRLIEVGDFGAGSRVFKTNRRKISDIAKNAGISQKRAELLYRLVSYLKLGKILEMGTSVGLATSAMSLGNPNGEITTLEGCGETASVAKKVFDKFNLSNISMTVSPFENALSDISHSKLDLIFFDGNHQKDATLQYFSQLLPTAHNDSIWIFDDIHWSADMEAAWQSIKQHPSVTVSIDTFQWGIVFFRKEQVKEDFVIRC